MSQGHLTDNERRTVQMFGKPYHWVREGGVLRLRQGVAPTETTMTLGEVTALAERETHV